MPIDGARRMRSLLDVGTVADDDVTYDESSVCGRLLREGVRPASRGSRTPPLHRVAASPESTVHKTCR